MKFHTDIKLDKDAQKKIADISATKEYEQVRELHDMILQTRVFELIRDNTLPREQREEELCYIAGAQINWQYIDDLIKRINEKP